MYGYNVFRKSKENTNGNWYVFDHVISVSAANAIEQVNFREVEFDENNQARIFLQPDGSTMNNYLCEFLVTKRVPVDATYEVERVK